MDNEFFSAVARLSDTNILQNLLSHAGGIGSRRGAGFITKDASVKALRPISIGAAKAGVDRYLVDAASEFFLQKRVKRSEGQLHLLPLCEMISLPGDESEKET